MFVKCVLVTAILAVDPYEYNTLLFSFEKLGKKKSHLVFFVLFDHWTTLLMYNIVFRTDTRGGQIDEVYF